MKVYRDECCGCATGGYPCLGGSCSNRHVPYLVCDDCGEDAEELYDVDGDEICEECLFEKFKKITLD